MWHKYTGSKNNVYVIAMVQSTVYSLSDIAFIVSLYGIPVIVSV